MSAPASAAHTAAACVCVYNPRSAEGRLGRQWPRLRQRLATLGLDCRPVQFAIETLTDELATALREHPCGTVLGIGGDGTHNAVLNSLQTIARRQGDRPLPYLPLPYGTGNDIAKSLGIRRGDRGLRQAVDLIRDDSESTLDLGTWGDLYFADALCVGLDAEILAGRDRLLAALAERGGLLSLVGGYPLYGVSAGQLLWRRPRWHGRVVVDGSAFYEGPVRNVVVNNVPIHAGEFEVTPGARSDDGWLNVAVFPRVLGYAGAYLRAFRHQPELVRRTLAKRSTTTRGRAIEIELDGESPIQVDGEIMGRERRVAIGVAPGAACVRAAANRR